MQVNHYSLTSGSQTGFDFNLSMISPNCRCLYSCRNNQSKLLLIETKYHLAILK